MKDRIINDPQCYGRDRRFSGNRAHQDVWNVHRICSPDEMAVVIEAVVPVMEDLRHPPRATFGTRLALEEAICNALKHGHRYDPHMLVEIRYRICTDHVLVEVEDQGAGFDPSQIADATAPENLERPCGRGLLLISHYAAWVRHNRKGNCVMFCICPSAALPAQLAPENIYANP